MALRMSFNSDFLIFSPRFPLFPPPSPQVLIMTLSKSEMHKISKYGIQVYVINIVVSMIVHFILDCSPEFLLAHFKESRDVLGFSTTTTNLRSSIASIPRLFIKRNKKRYFAKSSKSRKGENRSAQFAFLKHSRRSRNCTWRCKK